MFERRSWGLAHAWPVVHTVCKNTLLKVYLIKNLQVDDDEKEILAFII